MGDPLEITRRTDYAIRLMQELARSGEGPVSVRALAEKQGVPYAFARAVQRDLSVAGLIRTTRGAKGGAVLSRPSDQIDLYQIVVATQGTPSVSVCTADPEWCKFAGGCSVHRVWQGADELMREYLKDKTLAGLVSDQRK